MKRISPLREAGIIFVLSVIVALVYNSFSAKGLSIVRVEPKKVVVSDSALFMPDTSGGAEKKSGTSAANHIRVIAPLHERALRNPDSVRATLKTKKEETVYKIITLDQLNRLMHAHRGVLLDARSEQDYLKGHIKGARNIFGEEPEKHIEYLIQIPKDSLIIIYCNNPECHLGRSLAEFMAVLEFKNMVLYDDGWDGWEKAKMPVDTTAVSF